jgi:hypothetical protein
MEKKTKVLIIKLISLFLFPVIVTIIISGSVSITNYLGLFMIWYPIIFIFGLVRIILEYFDKHFYGDNLFILCVFLTILYGIKLPLIFLIGLNIISYFNKITNPRVLYKFFITLPIIIITTFLYGLPIYTIAIWTTIAYLILFLIGSIFVKYKKNDLFIEIISTLVSIPLYAKLYGVMTLFF